VVCDLVVVCVWQAVGGHASGVLGVCAWCGIRSESLVLVYISGLGTSVEVVGGRTNSKLFGFGILSCWLQVSCKCARLECVRVPFEKSEQWYQIRREGMIPHDQNSAGVESQQAHRVIIAVPVRFGTLTLTKQHPLCGLTAPHAAKPQRVMGPLIGLLGLRVGERWGAVSFSCSLVNGPVSPGRAARFFVLLKLPAY